MHEQQKSGKKVLNEWTEQNEWCKNWNKCMKWKLKKIIGCMFYQNKLNFSILAKYLKIYNFSFKIKNPFNFEILIPFEFSF